MLLYNGGKVCDDNFDSNDANIICRHMGYTKARTFGSVENPNGNSITKWNIQDEYIFTLDDVICPTVGVWSDCTYRNGYTDNCLDYDDMLISCSGEQSTILDVKNTQPSLKIKNPGIEIM